MLKKTAIAAFILMIVFSIAFAALIPLATADMISAADDRNTEFSLETELLRQSAEGISSVKLTGDWINELEVTASADDDIHLITNGYRIRRITSLTPTVDENGTLFIDIKMDQSSRVNRSIAAISRAVMAELYNNSYNYIRLELPEGTGFISGGSAGYNYGELDIADDVAVSERACPICGDIDCVDPDCAEELAELRAELAAERAELERELAEEREERREERKAERSEEREQRRAEMEELLSERRAGGGY